jgi:hypothetical protein
MLPDSRHIRRERKRIHYSFLSIWVNTIISRSAALAFGPPLLPRSVRTSRLGTRTAGIAAKGVYADGEAKRPRDLARAGVRRALARYLPGRSPDHG